MMGAGRAKKTSLLEAKVVGEHHARLIMSPNELEGC